MAYLLDTNVWVAHLRRRSRHVQEKLQQAGQANVFLSSIIKAELLFGAYKSADAPKNLQLLANIFSAVQSIPFTDVAAERYAQIRIAIERAGKPIGAHDLLIAATAVANDLTVVTHNTAEFSRVPGLAIEDWEAPSNP